MKFKRVFITGGAGYCGSRLVPFLLEKGYEITVFDILYYGSKHLPLNHPNLNIVKGDIRDIDHLRSSMRDHDAIIHLACISNDASFVLDEKLSTSVNYDAFEPMVIAAKELGLKRFIYASTSSVYGVSEEPEIKETHPLIPITLYNKFKGMCEPLLWKHTNEHFEGVAYRPATVCGYGPRQRLDVSVNILTNFAVNRGAIKVFGGSQLRPNLHIDDYARLCLLFLETDGSKIANEVFNCGYQNMSIMEIAQTVKRVVEKIFPEKAPISIEVEPSDDIRSYHINSDKIKQQLGFAPELSVEEAVEDLCAAFRKGKLPNSFDDDAYFNVRTMQKNGAK